MSRPTHRTSLTTGDVLLIFSTHDDGRLPGQMGIVTETTRRHIVLAIHDENQEPTGEILTLYKVR